MNVADTCCQHIYAQISDHLTFLRICALAHTYNTVFLAADGTNLSFQRKSQTFADTCQLFCLLNVLFDRIMRTIEHDG